MVAVPPPTSADLEMLLADGAHFIRALRPVWRAVTRGLPRGSGRKYFAFAMGIVGVAVAGTYIIASVRRRDRDTVVSTQDE